MTEQKLWIKLRAAALENGLFPERYENAASFGTYDSSLSWENQTLWIELKGSVDEELRTSQLRWTRARFNRGCTNDMYVLFGDKYRHRICLLPSTYVLDTGGRLSYDHAMVFSYMDELVIFLKENWRLPWKTQKV